MAASIGYGLCAYSTAFIMQFMWTDGLFLAPLVLLGLERFINGKSPLMYILMLALTIYTNFYTGFGVCLFTGFYFIAEWIKREYTGKDGAKLRGASEWKARGILFVPRDRLRGNKESFAFRCVEIISFSASVFFSCVTYSIDFCRAVLLW